MRINAATSNGTAPAIPACCIARVRVGTVTGGGSTDKNWRAIRDPRRVSLPARPAHTAGTSPQPLPQRPAHTGATSPQPPYRSLLPPSATPTLTTSPPSPPQPSSWWQKDSRGGKLEHDEGTTEAICLSDPPPPDGDPDPCARTRGVAMPVRCRKPRTSALSDVLYDWDSVRCSA